MNTFDKEYFGMIAPETLNKLNSQNWEIIIPKLVNYAVFRLRIMRWQTSRQSTHSDLKAEAEDFALEAIKLVYAGTRKWNPDKIPDILLYLKGTVRSLISHHVASPGHKRRHNLSPKFMDDEKAPNPIEVIPMDRHDEPHELRELKGKEIETYLLNWAVQDETLQTILHCLFNGMKRADISIYTGKQLSTLDNYIRKIRRALIKFLDNDNN